MNETYKDQIIKRFWERVKIIDNNCWEWKSYKHSFGYGVITSRKKFFEFAHRISWEIHNGEIPKGYCVLHKCDNPECTNPDHLFLGTKDDNNKDMTKKSRNGHRKSKGEGYKLSKSAIKFIRLNYDHKTVKLKDLAEMFNVNAATVWYWLQKEM